MVSNKHIAGLIAGFIATIALSIVMILKAAAGMLPDLNVPAMLGMMSGAGPAGGWLIHFIIGTVLWGLLFASLYESVPGGTPLMKGLAFSVGAWLLMMIIMMPIAGAGFFGLGLGVPAPVATLILHLIYGAVLGLAYARTAPAATASSPATQSG